MLMGVKSLELKDSFSHKVPYQKQKLWQISLLLSGCCLLGYLTATDHGILRLDPMGTLGTADCNTVDDTFVRELKIPQCVPGNWKLQAKH